MEIHYDADVSDEHRRQVERWAAANHAPDVDSIGIHDRLVSVRGARAELALAAGTAMRGDDLAAELSAALTNMRSLFGQ